MQRGQMSDRRTAESIELRSTLGYVRIEVRILLTLVEQNGQEKGRNCITFSLSLSRSLTREQ